jgi:hypothetical protein
MRRSLVIALAIVVILAIAWSGAWFWLAGWVDRNAEKVLAEANARGVAIDCRNRSVVGFPFALKIACAGTTLAERASGTQAELGGLTGGMSVFAPRTARIDFASPAALTSPLLAEPTNLSWRGAGVEVGIDMNGPRTIGFDSTALAGEIALPGAPKAALAAASADGTIAPNADGGTAAALAFTGLSLMAGGTTYPPFDGQLSADLSVPPRGLLAGRAALQPPLTARAIKVTLKSGGARVQLEGDVSVDAEGIMDGDLALRVAGAEALPAFIAALPPDKQKAGNAAVGAIIAFGKPAKLDGEKASELHIEIKHGKARVGPVEVKVPRLPM